MKAKNYEPDLQQENASLKAQFFALSAQCQDAERRVATLTREKEILEKNNEKLLAIAYSLSQPFYPFPRR